MYLLSLCKLTIIVCALVSTNSVSCKEQNNEGNPTAHTLFRDRRTLLGGEVLFAYLAKHSVLWALAHTPSIHIHMISAATMKKLGYTSAEHMARAMFYEYSGFNNHKMEIKNYIKEKIVDLSKSHKQKYLEIKKLEGEE
eukprot:Pgem_evm1s2212